MAEIEKGTYVAEFQVKMVQTGQPVAEGSTMVSIREDVQRHQADDFIQNAVFSDNELGLNKEDHWVHVTAMEKMLDWGLKL